MRGRTSVLGIMTVALVLIAGVAVAGHLQSSETDVQDVFWFADPPVDTGGESVLTRTDKMVLATVEAAGLEPGNAYTVWWVVFNNPGACSDGVCGEDDILNEDGTLNGDQIIAAKIAIGNATGNVAKNDGTAEFGARLKQGDDSGHQVLFPAGFTGDSVLTASGNAAEVHIVIQDHGQARGGPQLGDQLALFNAACTPFCGDIQFSVHLPEH